MYDKKVPNLTEIMKAILLLVTIWDEDSMEEITKFYACSTPRVGEEFRGRMVTNVAWNSTEETGPRVHVYTKGKSAR